MKRLGARLAASPFTPPLALVLAGLAAGEAILACGRVAVHLSHRPGPALGGDTATLAAALWHGLRFDLSGLAYPLIAAVLVSALLLALPRRGEPSGPRSTLAPGVATVLAVTAFVTLADWRFFGEFRTHLDFVALEYLDDPGTTFGMIGADLGWGAFVGLLLLTAAIGALALRALTWLERRSTASAARPVRWFHALVLVPVLFVGARGGFGRPIRPQDAAHAATHYGNQLALNGLFTLERQAFEALDSDGPGPDYGEDPRTALTTVRALLTPIPGPAVHFLDDLHPVLRRVTVGAPRARNVVLVILESFAARHVGALGAPPADARTPCFDALSAEGRLFTRYYSTGPSTNRSLPALLAGLPCLPTRTALTKASAGAQPLLTLGSVLAPRGFGTAFCTAGESSWENLGGWAHGQGFATGLDASDFEDGANSVFGVPDHVLLDRALSSADDLAARGPFAQVVLTASNHPPFALPDPLPDGLARALDALPAAVRDDPRARAFAYSDWAVARFVRAARGRPWGADTLFVLVGDHGLHDAPVTDVDLARHHVPLLLLGPGAAPGRDDRLGSHVDVLPTVLADLGVDGPLAAYGTDLLSGPASPRYAVLGPHGGIPVLGVLDDAGHLLVDRLDGRATLFDVDSDGVTLTASAAGADVAAHLRHVGRAVTQTFHQALEAHRAGPLRN